MKLDKTNIWLLCIVGILICTMGASADYVEGVDTTDANGFGLDSAFLMDNYWGITGQYILSYRFQFSTGYFNYSFDDIKMAPDSGYSMWCSGMYPCVVKNNMSNAFSKIQILKQLMNKRYIYEFGTNTTPNNRMLEKANYDRSIRYKPNNFRIGYNSLGYNLNP